MDELRCPANHSYYVYERAHTPTRYHYSHNTRIGDIIMEGDGEQGTIMWKYDDEQIRYSNIKRSYSGLRRSTRTQSAITALTMVSQS